MNLRKNPTTLALLALITSCNSVVLQPAVVPGWSSLDKFERTLSGEGLIVQLKADVSASMPTAVDFYIDGEFKGTDTTAPFELETHLPLKWDQNQYNFDYQYKVVVHRQNQTFSRETLLQGRQAYESVFTKIDQQGKVYLESCVQAVKDHLNTPPNVLPTATDCAFLLQKAHPVGVVGATLSYSLNNQFQGDVLIQSGSSINYNSTTDAYTYTKGW